MFDLLHWQAGSGNQLNILKTCIFIISTMGMKKKNQWGKKKPCFIHILFIQWE